MSNYKSAYNEKAVGQVVPILIMVFLGVLYVTSAQNNNVYVSFVLIAAGALTMVFWVSVIKQTIKAQVSQFVKREPETKNWMYDLIKGDSGFDFIAQVPGPEDKIMVRLISGVLYIRGSGGFAREVPVAGSENMQISDFKYRNGTLALRIN